MITIGRTTRRPWLALLPFLVLTMASPAVAQTFSSSWSGDSGQLPDQICPAWRLSENATPEDPMLSGGVLVVSTDQFGEDMVYQQVAPADIAFQFPFTIEIRVRLVAGVTVHPARAPITLTISTGPNTGTMIGIDHDRVFILDGDLSAGSQAVVDTNDAFHTYRVVIEAHGAVSVFHDGVLILSGALFVSSTAFGNTPGYITWGEGSSLAWGTSQWEFVRHTAGASGTCGAAYACTGFESPFDVPIALKAKVNRAIPLKMQLFENGTAITPANIAGGPPVVNVTYSAGGGPAVDVTAQLEPVGQSSEGNSFTFDAADGRWVFNLGTKPYSAAGTYTVTVAPADTTYSVAPTCTGQFVRSN